MRNGPIQWAYRGCRTSPTHPKVSKPSTKHLSYILTYLNIMIFAVPRLRLLSIIRIVYRHTLIEMFLVKYLNHWIVYTLFCPCFHYAIPRPSLSLISFYFDLSLVQLSKQMFALAFHPLQKVIATLSKLRTSSIQI